MGVEWPAVMHASMDAQEMLISGGFQGGATFNERLAGSCVPPVCLLCGMGFVTAV